MLIKITGLLATSEFAISKYIYRVITNSAVKNVMWAAELEWTKAYLELVWLVTIKNRSLL